MTLNAAATVTLENVRYGFASRPDFLGPVNVTIRGGECWSIIGPNGAGKSTLLRLIAGLYQPAAGRVRVGGKLLSELGGRERARCIAFLPQSPPGDLDLPARDVVLMGRFPHRSLGLFESRGDYRIADRAMAITRTTDLANRPINTLSGGEAQRVHVAGAIAQEPQVLLLDEPTASLDLQHELAIFQILRERADTDGLAVVVVTHDVNLAARFCTHVLLMCDGRVAAAGPPDAVVKPEILEPVYGVELTTLAMRDDPDCRWVVPTGTQTGGRS